MKAFYYTLNQDKLSILLKYPNYSVNINRQMSVETKHALTSLSSINQGMSAQEVMVSVSQYYGKLASEDIRFRPVYFKIFDHLINHPLREEIGYNPDEWVYYRNLIMGTTTPSPNAWQRYMEELSAALPEGIRVMLLPGAYYRNGVGKQIQGLGNNPEDYSVFISKKD